jgi:hypothetical protein
MRCLLPITACNPRSCFGDPDERHDEGVEAVLALTRVTRAGFGNATRADDLGVGLAQPAQANALDEDVPDLGPVVRRTQTQLFHRALETIEIVLQAEEVAAPDVGHVIGRIRSQKSPVEDRDSRLRNGYELPVDEGRAIRVGSMILRRSYVVLHLSLPLHFRPSCDNHRWLSSDAGREPLKVGPISRFRTSCVNAFICGV